MSSSNCPAPTNGGGDNGSSLKEWLEQEQKKWLEQKEWLEQEEKKWLEPKKLLEQELKEKRELLVVLATLAASVTYQAGLNPPGGFWHDDGNSNQVMYDYVVPRYLIFYYLNATAFVTSLFIVTLLLSKTFYDSEAKIVSLILITLVDLMSLVGAYIAGSTRDMHSSIYIIVLTCFLFVCVVYLSRRPALRFIVMFMAPRLLRLRKGWLPRLLRLTRKGWLPRLLRLTRKGWLPVTDNMETRVERAKERQKADKEQEEWVHLLRERALQHQVR